VRDLAPSKGFYELALAPLGYSLLLEYPGVIDRMLELLARP
jgi:hypothetical protein